MFKHNLIYSSNTHLEVDENYVDSFDKDCCEDWKLLFWKFIVKKKKNKIEKAQSF